MGNKVNDLANGIPDFVQIFINVFVANILALVVSIYTLWRVDAGFGFFMLLWAGSFLVLSILFSKRLALLSDAWSELGSTVVGKVVDALSNMLSVRLFARRVLERTTLGYTVDRYVKAEQKLEWSFLWILVFYCVSFGLMQAGNLYLLIKGRQEGWISVGDFVLVMTINIIIFDFLWMMTLEISRFSELWGRITQALRAIVAVPNIQDKTTAKPLVIKKGEIIFDSVEFQYGSNNGALFQNQSVVIAAGQKVGLVGYSGGGKSTFINLIIGLFDVDSGRILIDGQDIQDVTQDSLREAIAVIPQDPSLFHRSLMENIRYGRVEATDEEVIEAAKEAHIHEFISTLPQGYDTLVGERGLRFSGGQRQRIAIARAILKDAPILILDEATSQLDSVTEDLIQESLWKLTREKTTIAVAHRLSTLLHMDRILVFDRGKIVEDGTHQGLLDNGHGLYKTLWEAQVGGFLPDTIVHL